jgi:hypothetical protein
LAADLREQDANFLQSLPEARIGDRVYRPNQMRMVPLLTLARTISAHRRKRIPQQCVSWQMTSRCNDLGMKDLPVDVELSRI